MKKEKKYTSIAERNARRRRMRKRFRWCMILAVAAFLVLVFSWLFSIDIGGLIGLIPFISLLLGGIGFSGYVYCGGNRDTHGADVAIVIMIMGVTFLLVFAWYAILFIP